VLQIRKLDLEIRNAKIEVAQTTPVLPLVYMHKIKCVPFFFPLALYLTPETTENFLLSSPVYG